MINIKLQWDDTAEDASTNKYDLYKSTYKFDITTLPEPIITGFDSTSYTDYDILPNVTYYYMIGIRKANNSYALSLLREVTATDKDIYIDFVSSFVLASDKASNKAFSKSYTDIKGLRTVINNNNVRTIESRFGIDKPYVLSYWGNSTTSNNSVNGRLSATILALGTTNFTYEIICQISRDSYQYGRITQIGTNSNGFAITKYSTVYPYRISLEAYTTVWTTLITTNNTYLDDEYLHICVMRNAGVFYLFVNGILEGTATASVNITSTALYIFANSTYTEYLNGLFDSARLTKGINRYALTGFTPPTQQFPKTLAEDPSFASNDILLLVHDGSLNDYSSNNRAVNKTRLGTVNCQLINPYLMGKPMIYFDGNNGNRLYSTVKTFNKDDFTIECYLKPDAVNSNALARVITFGVMSTEGMMCIYYPGATGTRKMQVAIYYNSGWVYPVVSPVIPDNTTFHFCLMRKDNIIYMFIDGVMVSKSGNYSSVTITDDMLSVGMNSANGEAYVGGLYDLRITNKARYLPTGFHIKPEPFYKDVVINNVNTAVNENKEIVLSWDYNATAKSTALFDIYRSDTEFDITTLPEFPLDTDITTNSYIDTTAEFNTYYYYGIVCKLPNRDIGYNLYTYRGVVTDSDLAYNSVASIIENNRTINKTNFVSTDNTTVTYTNTGVYTVGPYFNDNIGFCRVLGTSTTANNTVNGKLTGTMANAFGTADFTIELIIAPRWDKCATDAVFLLVGLGDAVVGSGIQIARSGTTNKIKARFHNGSNYVEVISTSDLPTKSYSVIALVKRDGVFYLYVNGIRESLSAAYPSINFFNKTLHIFSDETNVKYFSGEVDSIRITSGIARYIYDTYTIEKFTNTESNYSNVTLLLNFNNYGNMSTNFVGLSSNPVVITPIGDIKNYELHRVDSSLLYFDGASHLYSDIISVGKSDFTIELTFTPILINALWQTLINFGTMSTNGCMKLAYYNNILQLQVYHTSWRYAGYYTMSTDKVRVAAMRKNGVLYFFVDGKCVGSHGGTQASSLLQYLTNFYIGNATNNEYLTGYISDIRISLIARYSTTSYTLPTLPYKKFSVIKMQPLTAVYNGTDTITVTAQYDGLMKKYALYRSSRAFTANTVLSPILSGDITSETIVYNDTNIEQNKLYYYMMRFTDDNTIYSTDQVNTNTFDIIEWDPSSANMDSVVWLNPTTIEPTETTVKWNNFTNTSQYFESTNNPTVVDNTVVFNGSASLDANQPIIDLINNKDSRVTLFVLKQPTTNSGYETIIDICNTGNSIAKFALGDIAGGSNKISSRIIVDGTTVNNGTTNALNDNQYHIVIIETSASGMYNKIYIDGTNVGTVTLASSNVSTAITSIKIGADYDNTHGMKTIIPEVVLSANSTITTSGYIDRLNGYMAHKYGITNLLPANHPYKTSTPKMSYAIVDTSIEFSNYAARLTWNVRDYGDSFRIYRGYSSTTIDKAIPYAEVTTNSFNDFAVENNEIYFYQIDHILDNVVVSSDIIDINTSVKGIWAVSCAAWGTTIQSNLNPSLQFEPTWETNFRYTSQFLLNGFKYQTTGRYTSSAVAGTINVKPLGLKFYINNKIAAQEWAVMRLYFEDDAGVCYAYINLVDDNSYTHGTRVYIGKDPSSTSEVSYNTYSNIDGEIEVRTTGVYFITRKTTGDFVPSFSITNSNIINATRVRIENATSYVYSIATTTVKGGSAYIYLQCI